jgi:hypothetical protein
MLCAAILACLSTGAGFAFAATRVPSHAPLLESCGGGLIALSLILLGGALPIVL